MNNYCMNIVLFVVVAMVAGCSRPVPQDAFRVQTRGKFHLFGFVPLFSVPNPFISVNLKTNTAPGAAGTTGAIPEFNPGGQNVRTDAKGKFDAANAVLPAVWNAKVAPNQTTCRNPAAAIVSFSAVRGSKHRINCNFNIQIGLRVEPSFVEVGRGSPLTVVADAPRFLNARGQNLKILYYKQDRFGEEDYTLAGEGPVMGISDDGTALRIAVPNSTLSLLRCV